MSAPDGFDLAWYAGQVVLAFVAGFSAGTIIRIGRQMLEKL